MIETACTQKQVLQLLSPALSFYIFERGRGAYYTRYYESYTSLDYHEILNLWISLYWINTTSFRIGCM